ncbi:MAG: hypothetical protein FWH05_09210 [Oscillospiraceae bacterium]|nr:hypothetical protein [Oscillospiraceae bacterium]
MKKLLAMIIASAIVVTTLTSCTTPPAQPAATDAPATEAAATEEVTTVEEEIVDEPPIVEDEVEPEDFDEEDFDDEDIDIDLSSILAFRGENEEFEAYLLITGDEFMLAIEQGDGNAVGGYVGAVNDTLLESADEEGTLFGFDGELLITEDFGDFIMEIAED